MRKLPFELSKWYMDCVSGDGDAVIAYAADLRWRNLAVAYENVLEVRGTAAAASRTSIRPHAEPDVTGPLVSWRSASLGVDARWSSRHLPIRETIYRSQAGSIEWSCIVPAGSGSARTRTGEIHGFGYVEHLHMTVAPWRLPIQSLRWGRISAEDDSIVWIQWTGENCVTFVYEADAALGPACSRVEATSLDDERVALVDGTVIAFDRGRVLRRAALGTTIGVSVPALRRLGPARMLAAEECKWLSRATIGRPGRPVKGGWAIHELVTWPKRPVRRSA